MNQLKKLLENKNNLIFKFIFLSLCFLAISALRFYSLRTFFPHYQFFYVILALAVFGLALKWPFYVFLVFVFLSPVSFFPSIISFEPQIVFWSLILGWAFLKFLKSENFLKWPGEILSYFGLLILTVFISALTLAGFVPEAVLRLLQFLEWPLIFLVAFDLLDSKARINLFLKGITLSLLIVVLYGVFQYFTGFNLLPFFNKFYRRVNAFWPCPNSLGAYLILVLLPAAAGLNFFSGRSRFFIRGTLGLGYFCLFLTFSRASWFGLIAASLFYFLARRPKQLFKLVMGAILGIVLFTVIVYFLGLSSLSRIFNFPKGLSLVWSYWQAALMMMFEHPFLGVGPGRFLKVLPKYFPWLGVEDAHSLVLNIGAEIGFLGIGAILLIWWSLLEKGWQKIKLGAYQNLKYLIAASLLGFFCESAQPLFIFNLAVIFWSLAGLLFALDKI